MISLLHLSAWKKELGWTHFKPFESLHEFGRYVEGAYLENLDSHCVPCPELCAYSRVVYCDVAEMTALRRIDSLVLVLYYDSKSHTRQSQ